MSIWKSTKQTVPGFISAGLFDREGMLLDGYSDDPDFHIEHAAATFVTLVSESDSAGDFVGLGKAQEVQLTYDDAFILLRTVNGTNAEMIVGLASRKDVPLGRVRMGMDLLIKKLPSKEVNTSKVVGISD